MRPAEGLRVHLVNWRDGSHPQAGGAEVFCDQVARRLVARGAVVTLVTSRAPGQPARETVDGVQLVRGGNRWTVYPRALAHLAGVRGQTDLVVDCQNGLPFFSPLVLRRRTPVVLLVHHVHQEQFSAHFPAPLARLGRWLEGPVSRAVYRDRAVAVVSPSTRTAVRRQLRLRGPVHVVPNGTATVPLQGRSEPRAPHPTIVCVGRLVVHKRLDRLLRAVGAVRSVHPGLVVHIVGDGPDGTVLRRLARQLGLDEVVRFHGRLPARERDALLVTAWLTVNPSMGEGWGLGVLEAASLGVPAVAADVPGLRDAVRAGITGWLIPDGADLAAAVAAALTHLREPRHAAAMAVRCRQWAATFDWDRTTDRLLDVGRDESARRGRRPSREQRRRSDLTTWAEVVADRPEEFRARASALLRPHDMVQQGSARAWLLLHACDEVDTQAVAARLGADLLSAQVATGSQLLGALVPVAGAGSVEQTNPAPYP